MWADMREKPADSPMLMVKGKPKRTAGKVGRQQALPALSQQVKSGGSGEGDRKITRAE